MASEFDQVYEIYTRLQTNRDRAKPLWDDIANVTGIQLDPDYAWHKDTSHSSKQQDEYVDDPTSAISVNQAGDYLVGVMWGTGENVFNMVPSRHVLELTDEESVEDYYDYATDQSLYHMNHPEAGFASALRPYSYDQISFGTSGIGTFLNEDFIDKGDENALIYRNYGVDNVVIDEGKSGLVDYVFATYHWRVNRIVGEFAMEAGELIAEKFDRLPKPIKDAYKKNDINQVFTIAFGFMPRSDFNARLKGKRGTRYKGVWFMPENKAKSIPASKAFFAEEDFTERPIAMARMIRLRGEVWGRSPGTMLISSIRSVNYMIGTAIEVIEKMADPALGTFSNAVFGDSVLDTSSTGLTVFNSSFAGQNGNPTFPLYDVGDPSALVEFLVPYLNEKITTAFKVDALLDFNANKDMTATESLQRYTIRGQSLSGMLGQQKNEFLIPVTKRSISLLMNIGELGANPRTQPERAKRLAELQRNERIIPEAVLQVMEQGKPWYELKFNNELERLMRTEAVQNLLQILQAIIAVSGVYPNIIEAVDWYKMIKDINDNLDQNNQILIPPAKFKENIARIAQAQAAQGALAAQGQVAEVEKTEAEATNKRQEAQGR